MAEVFLARQRGPEGFDRIVALKRILPHLVDSAEFVDMFLHEAKLAARLSHANIVHIYDFGKVDEQYFIAMEFVDGCHAGALIKRAAHAPMPPALVARVGADACAGLHHAHQLRGSSGRPLRIVHRDISPPNLLVSYDGMVKLADFGIAKAATAVDATRPGVVKGKFGYVSPEQAGGETLDGRSDVFSLGLVLYELLSGKPAVERKAPMDAMRQIRKGKVPRIESARPDVPTELAEALAEALAVSPQKRPTALELGAALEGFIKSSPELGTSLQLASWIDEHGPRREPVTALVGTSAGEGTGMSQGRGGTSGDPRPGTALGTAHGTSGGTAAAGTHAGSAGDGRAPTAARSDTEVSDWTSSPSPAHAPAAGQVAGVTEAPDRRGSSAEALPIVPPAGAAGTEADDHALPPADTDQELPSEPEDDAGEDTRALELDTLAATTPLGQRTADAAELPALDPPSSPAAAPGPLVPGPAQYPTLPAPSERWRGQDRAAWPRGQPRPDAAPVGRPMGIYSPDFADTTSVLTRHHGGPRRAFVALAAVLVAGLMGAAGAGAIFHFAAPGNGGADGGLDAGAPAATAAENPETPPDARAPLEPDVEPLVATPVPPDAAPPPDSAPPAADLTIITDPEDAQVVLEDTGKSGRSPLTFEDLEPGSHEIAITLEGYEPARREIHIGPDEHRSLEMPLQEATDRAEREAAARRAERQRRTSEQRRRARAAEREPEPPEPGKLVVRTQPYSEVYIGERRLGTTPFADVELPPGTYTLTFRNPDRPPHTRQITIEPGGEKRLNFPLP